MFSLINIPRDHLFTIFSFCSTPSLGNLAKVCKDLKVKVGEYLKIRYSDEKIALFKENHKIKKVILKKIELNSFPVDSFFEIKMPDMYTETVPLLSFGEGNDFFIFYNGKIKLIDLKNGTNKDIKICVNISVFFNTSIRKNFFLENSTLINRTKLHLLLKDSVLNIYAVFSLATKTIQFASSDEILFHEADEVILYNGHEVIIVKKNQKKLSIEFHDLTVRDFKNGILIVGGKDGRLIGIDVKNNQILFEKKFDFLNNLKIVDDKKFVIQTKDYLYDHETLLCECKSGKIIFKLNLDLQGTVLSCSGKFIANQGYSSFCVVDIETGKCEEVKTNFSHLHISNNRLIVHHGFSHSIGKSAISIYDLSSLKIIGRHYFEAKNISISPINDDFYAIASDVYFQGYSFFGQEHNFFYGILDPHSGTYKQLNKDFDRLRSGYSKMEASNNYIVDCASYIISTERWFGGYKHELQLAITVRSLMDDDVVGTTLFNI